MEKLQFAADCRDLELLVKLWNGSPTTRSVALELADRNREDTKRPMRGELPKDRAA